MSARLHEIERREREANEALYAVDPDFALEMGYVPPPAPPVRNPDLYRNVPSQETTDLHRALMSQASAVQAQQQVRPSQGLFGQLAGAVGGGMGPLFGGALGASLGKVPGQR